MTNSQQPDPIVHDHAWSQRPAKARRPASKPLTAVGKAAVAVAVLAIAAGGGLGYGIGRRIDTDKRRKAHIDAAMTLAKMPLVQFVRQTPEVRAELTRQARYCIAELAGTEPPGDVLAQRLTQQIKIWPQAERDLARLLAKLHVIEQRLRFTFPADPHQQIPEQTERKLLEAAAQLDRLSRARFAAGENTVLTVGQALGDGLIRPSGLAKSARDELEQRRAAHTEFVHRLRQMIDNPDRAESVAKTQEQIDHWLARLDDRPADRERLVELRDRYVQISGALGRIQQLRAAAARAEQMPEDAPAEAISAAADALQAHLARARQAETDSLPAEMLEAIAQAERTHTKLRNMTDQAQLETQRVALIDGIVAALATQSQASPADKRQLVDLIERLRQLDPQAADVLAGPSPTGAGVSEPVSLAQMHEDLDAIEALVDRIHAMTDWFPKTSSNYAALVDAAAAIRARVRKLKAAQPETPDSPAARQ